MTRIQEITPADLGQLEFLTLREVAQVLKLTPESVRQLCIKWESGDGAGLRCVSVGSGGKRQRRIHIDWLREFTQLAARESQRESRREARLSRESQIPDAAVIQYIT